MQRNRAIAWALLAFFFLQGCEQEVNLPLEEGEPQLVIEGWVTDQPGPYEFTVRRTGSYFGSTEDIMVGGATLILKDDMGGVDTLEEQSAGRYFTGHLNGQREHAYSMEVEVEGEVYSASNYLPRINPFNFVVPFYSDTLVFGEGYYILVGADEPAGIGDFYQFRIFRNDSLFNGPGDVFFSDDRLVDGQESLFVYPYPHEEGDTVVVEIRSISNLTYDFLITYFQQLNGGGGPFGSPPENLITNWDKGALGFLGTASTTRDTVIIQ